MMIDALHCIQETGRFHGRTRQWAGALRAGCWHARDSRPIFKRSDCSRAFYHFLRTWAVHCTHAATWNAWSTASFRFLGQFRHLIHIFVIPVCFVFAVQLNLVVVAYFHKPMLTGTKLPTPYFLRLDTARFEI